MKERPKATPDFEVKEAMRRAAAEHMIIQSLQSENQFPALSEEDRNERDALFAEVLGGELTKAEQESAKDESQVSAPEQPEPEDRKPHTSMQDSFDKLNS